MKIGIMGAGNIAGIVAPTLARLDEIECYAVASRSLEKAQSFAEKFGFQVAYGSYEELLLDPEVDLVYVATPHSHHYDCIMDCLRHGKPVISEKPFTVNAEQAREIREYAEEHRIFVAEAIWPRYMPSRRIIRELIDSGEIGNVRALTASPFYAISHNRRLIDPALAGGALLDVGIYGINFALMNFGTDIERVESSVQLTVTGVDGMETVTIFFDDGRMAVISAGIFSESGREGVIYGDKGYITVESIINPRKVSVYNTDNELVRTVEIPEQISGYEYEFIECAEAIRDGRIETRSMPMEDTIFVLELMDELRRDWGVMYPQELEIII
jgi:predicted dehydrogenase